MARGNYGTRSVNEKGEVTDGKFTSPLGVTVELYKNWIYVHDSDAWTEDSPFSSNVVMRIQEGEIIYKDVEIHAVRGPQDSICVVVIHTEYEDDGVHLTAMVGVSSYGYDNDKYVGLLPTTVEFLVDWVANSMIEEEACFYEEDSEGKRLYHMVREHRFSEEVRNISFKNLKQVEKDV